MKRKYGLADEGYDLLAPNRFIREACRRQGVPSLDLTPVLRAHARAGERLYSRHSRHWNREGNRLVARAMQDWLGECGLVASAPGETPGGGVMARGG